MKLARHFSVSYSVTITVSNHLPTTYRPLTDVPTTYRPHTDLLLMYQPLTDHLPTAYRPHTDHIPTTFFMVQLVQYYRIL